MTHSGVMGTINLSRVLQAHHVTHSLLSVSCSFENGLTVLFPKERYLFERENAISGVQNRTCSVHDVELSPDTYDHALAALEKFEDTLILWHAVLADNDHCTITSEQKGAVLDMNTMKCSIDWFHSCIPDIIRNAQMNTGPHKKT